MGAFWRLPGSLFADPARKAPCGTMQYNAHRAPAMNCARPFHARAGVLYWA